MKGAISRRLWWLTVYDPETGIATRIVGVVGTEPGDRHLSWMPLDDGAARWADAIHNVNAIDNVDDFDNMVAVDIDAAATVADGIILGFVAIADPPASPDLAGAVEAAIDLALGASIETRRSA